LFPGPESLKPGHRGHAHIAAILGMKPHTVTCGRRELMMGRLDNDRIRAAGAGRLPQEKTPEIIEATAEIMEYKTAGQTVS